MSLLFKGESIPETRDDIQELLDEIASNLNGLAQDFGATGDVRFDIQEPEASEEKWEIKVSGQISNGQ